MTALEMKALLLKMAADKSIPVEAIEKEITEFIRGKPILPFRDFPFAFVVRCSPNNGVKDGSEIFNHVNRCSYHPIAEKVEMGRCNYEKQQVFYAAVTSDVDGLSASSLAIIEGGWRYIKNKRIQRYYFTLSRWRTNRILKVFALPFAKRSHRKNRDFKTMNRDYIRLLRKACKDYWADYRELKTFMMFMSNVFCKRTRGNYYYRISSAFTNSILKYAPEMDGIIYPSAQTRAEGMNIVLRKDLIDNGTLKCDYVTMMAMQRDPSNPKHIVFPKASPDTIPDINGKLHFQHII
jgi:hypothetical protein